MALTVNRKRLLESPDINLSGDRYREAAAVQSKWQMVKLGDDRFFTIESGGTPSSTVPAYWGGDIRWVTLVDLPQGESFTEIKHTQRTISETGLKNSSAVLLPKRAVLVSSRATIGRIGIALEPMATNQGFKNIVIRDFDQVNERYVAYTVARLVPVMNQMASGGTFKEISKTSFSHLEIPLPPLSIQQQMVAELDGYRKVIEGAHLVIANYKPTIKIDPEWPLEELETLCSNFQNGANFSKEQMGSGIRFVNISDLFSEGYVNWEQLSRVNLDEKEIERKRVSQDDLLFVRSSVKEEGVGFPSLMPACHEPVVFCGFIIKCSPIQERVLPKYLLFLLRTPIYRQKVVALSNRANITNISQDSIKSLIVPLPPLEIQRQIVTKIEAERALVEANRKLVEIFEKKIQAKLAEIWGGEEMAAERTKDT